MTLTRQVYHLATVQEWRGDRIQGVGCTNEQHLTEIDGNVQIVISERVVLLGVQNFQQCGRRISVKVVMSNLVDFIAKER